MTILEIVFVIEVEYQGKNNHQTLNDIGVDTFGKRLDGRPIVLYQGWVRFFTRKVRGKLGYVVWLLAYSSRFTITALNVVTRIIGILPLAVSSESS